MKLFSAKHLLCLLASLSFLAMATTAIADPIINRISGTVSNGSSITIFGSGFGEKSPAAPYFWDTVDNQSAYSGIADGTCVPLSGPNYVSDCTGNVAGAPFAGYFGNGGKGNTPVIMKSGPLLPNRESTYRCVETEGWECGLNGLTKGPASGATQMYAGWWIYPNYTNSDDVTSDKICRLVSGTDYQREVEFVWTTQNATSIYDHLTSTFQLNVWPGTGWNPPDPHWHFQEVLIDQATNRVWLYTDGKLIGNWTAPSGNIATGTIREVPNNIGSIGLNTNGTASGYQNWGDIYMDITFQRAELCPGPTWESRGQCTMLIPSEWSGTALKASINRGYFSNGTIYYLYVVDRTNTANRDGFPIRFGDTYSTTTRPAAPAGLTVN